MWPCPFRFCLFMWAVMYFHVIMLFFMNFISEVLKHLHPQSSPGRRSPPVSAILDLRTSGRLWRRRNMLWSCSTLPVSSLVSFAAYSLCWSYPAGLETNPRCFSSEAQLPPDLCSAEPFCTDVQRHLERANGWTSDAWRLRRTLKCGRCRCPNVWSQLCLGFITSVC